MLAMHLVFDYSLETYIFPQIQLHCEKAAL